MTASSVSEVASSSTVRRWHTESLERIRVLRSQQNEELRRARLAALRAQRAKRLAGRTR